MQIEFHTRLGKAERREITRMVIYDAKDNPTVVAIEFAPGMIFAATADHPDFNHILKNFGLDRTVIVQDVNFAGPDLREVSFD